MINTINRAIAKRREELAENDKGFTLIELLVVVLIIGILAAIAIPAFLSQREGAWAGQVESDLSNAVLAAESYSVGNGGSYVGLSDDTLAANGFNGTEDVTIAVSAVTATGYTLTGTHGSRDGDSWVYNSSTGETTGPDDAPAVTPTP